MLLARLFIAILTFGWIATAARAEQATVSAPIEEVLVTGEHPGPPLWKVMNGDHALYIMGTYAPLPERLVWRSEEVEWVMTEAQQVIGPYAVSFTLEGADPLAAKGAPLRRLLSRKDYAQWLTLKRRYIGEGREIERALPVSAALILRSAAFERTGLTNTDRVWRQIYSLAERYHVPVSASHQVDKTIWSDRLKKDNRAGVDYLIKTIEQLEQDLRAARARANAWATGDVAALRTQALADKDAAYLYASSWPYLRDEELAELLAEADRRWVAAAHAALTRNQTTFAALPIFMLLRPDGVLAGLQAQGFEVEEPD